jgi:ADP-ribose pyrophosphatase YjhB (NUDIX family)
MTQKYTIRIYGLVINEKGELLLSDEFALGRKLTKLPGGGMEPGEGTRDTLHREFMEELNTRIEVGEHFYTTDYYQPALTKPEYQLISIYYFVKITSDISDKISDKPFDKENFGPGDQSFRFEKISCLKAEDLSLPIDKLVLKKLKEQLKTSF